MLVKLSPEAIACCDWKANKMGKRLVDATNNQSVLGPSVPRGLVAVDNFNTVWQYQDMNDTETNPYINLLD